MGDPAVLRRFVETACKSYPAKRVALLCNDHGMSWPGVCFDETSKDFLTLPEIRAALQAAAPVTGKLEVVGFDACLMATLEVAATLAPVARVMVASEELEPGVGWNYTPLLQGLADTPEMTGVEFGRAAADTYKEFFAEADDEQTKNAGTGITLSVVSLDKVAALEAALNGFAAQCAQTLKQGGRDAWLRLAQARAGAEEYGNPQGGKAEGSIAAYDLLHLTRLIGKGVGDPNTTAAAEGVTRAFLDCLAHRVRGKGRPQANGLSIYFPPDPGALKQQGPMDYSLLPFARGSRWPTFLTAFTAQTGADAVDPELKETKASANRLKEGQEITLTADVDADDLEEAYFVLAVENGGERLIMGQWSLDPDDDGKLTEDFDGEWFKLSDGDREIICPLTELEEVEDEEDEWIAEVPAQIRRKNGKRWIDVTLHLYMEVDANEDWTGELEYAFEQTSAGPREIELRPGDQLRPVYIKTDAKGDVSLVASTDADQILKLDDPEDLEAYTDRIEPGPYLVGFVVTDLSGNSTAKFLRLDVQ